jgi:hypothetical protein
MYRIVIFFILVSCSLDTAIPVGDVSPDSAAFPIDTHRFVHPVGILYDLWRDQPVDAWHHNYWTGDTLYLDRWCLDSTGREHMVVGIGMICLSNNECIILK